MSKLPMKNVSNSTLVILTIAVALVFGSAGGFFGTYLLNEESKHNYAILDIEEAISKTTIGDLQRTTNKEEVKQIMSNGRKQVEGWLANRLEFYCAAPCVVFNKDDVVFGDVANLNSLYEKEVLQKR